MLFQTFTFLLVFLPVAFIGYEILSRIRNTRLLLVWLILCSFAFYAWGEPRFVWLFILSILVNYVAAEYMARAARHRKLALGFVILVNLSLLSYYKYAGFFMGSETSFRSAALPLAISFFTFQQITFLMQVYKRQIAQVSLLQYTAYISFFPQLIAGPIVRPDELVPQLTSAPVTESISQRLSFGITHFAIGLFKKVVIADSIKPFADEVFTAAQNEIFIPFILAWCGALAFCFYIYFDFSAYSDMAIGIARMFGFRLPTNFNAPYKALSVTDFWRRWHITLSNFLRDYVYIPLGGSRLGSSRTLVNILLTMLISGLWHGAGWLFLLWGITHGTLMCIHRIWARDIQSPIRNTVFWKPVSWLLTFIALSYTWVLFRADNLAQAWRIMLGMSGANGLALPAAFQGVKTHLFAFWWHESSGSTSAFVLDNWANNQIFWWLGALLVGSIVLPSTHEFMRQDATGSSIIRWKPTVVYGFITGGLLVISFYYMLYSTPEPFLYFRF